MCCLQRRSDRSHLKAGVTGHRLSGNSAPGSRALGKLTLEPQAVTFPASSCWALGGRKLTKHSLCSGSSLNPHAESIPISRSHSNSATVYFFPLNLHTTNSLVCPQQHEHLQSLNLKKMLRSINTPQTFKLTRYSGFRYSLKEHLTSFLPGEIR